MYRGYGNLFSFEAVDQGITVRNVMLRVFSFSCSVGFDRKSQSILFIACVPGGIVWVRD